ncbi:unnamed protein product [Choristocarpus tenellus]
MRKREAPSPVRSNTPADHLSPDSPSSQRPPSPFTSPSHPRYHPVDEPRPFRESPPQADGDSNRDRVPSKHRKGKSTHWARDVSSYHLMGPIGEGTYGKVWKARDPDSGVTVALKMIKTTDKDGKTNDGGFPITSIREIRILRSLRHPNIVDLLEVVTDNGPTVKDGKSGDVYMVFEYLEYDLWGLANSPEDVRLSPVHIKTYMKQMLTAIDYMHQNKVMHRDLKCANLFIGANGLLKVGDWGLARSFHEKQENHTPTVITLWYRPPEVLLRTTKYGPAVDMWSVGCILAELLHGSPILPGSTETQQLDLIFSLCGSPTDQSWPDRVQLPDWKAMGKTLEGTRKERTIRSKFKFDPYGVDLVDKLLTLDPTKRLSAAKALDHQYFWRPPLAVAPELLPKFGVSSCHEFEVKKKKEAERAKRKEGEAQALARAAANRAAEAETRVSDRW